MKKNVKIGLIAFGLVVTMASVGFAASDEGQETARGRFFRGMDNQRGNHQLLEDSGLTKEDLLQLREGKTMKEFMLDEDIDIDEMKEQMLQRKLEKIDQFVEDEKLTSEEAELLKQQIQERMEDCTDFDGKGMMMKGSMGRRANFKSVERGLKNWYDQQ
ncbi:hypothetical protein [Alkaliphilus peptidifermentans]|uniref:LTXXQ motif family protein n=1 Tax=Alkaliphilus peptidifermentans DSM 18978 TaxID=1120976 RepID=A0A1G5ASA1_9FIRM|nr:hypothetical protein [Alkaliphilus peptidifermentans]SCX80774.1 hypothetical protein SAMN03080606_00271 [Alkaliphilus peptidifermentans DSM 18978]